MESLYGGNAAKSYCLSIVRESLQNSRGTMSILDLGCGAAKPFAALLREFKTMRYVGIEPYPNSFKQASENLKGLNAAVHPLYAYDLYPKLQEKFDIIISFSTMEHVYRRAQYLACAKECLKDTGRILMNYDSGHFTVSGLRERINGRIGQVLAHVGYERYYQAFVKEKDFARLVEQTGLKIVESKSFNVHTLKGYYKKVPENQKAKFAERWVDFELSINELSVPYDDSQARIFGTRNFILTHA